MTDEDKAADGVRRQLDNLWWRLNNLYKIIVKSGDDDDGLVMQFRPNRAQRRLLDRLHNRNLILKARQMGFTTLIAVLWLDTALFSKSPIRCGIIAHSREDAEAIFRDKVKFAYDNLPDDVRAAFPLERRSASELVFAHNGASIRVATSMRSGTIHRLHVSEFGKICAKYPDKAKEIITGSLPAVPQDGMAVIESTAEGQDGPFYKMVQRALAMEQQGKPLSIRDWMLHFFPWWDEPSYALADQAATISEKDRQYFAELEAKIGVELTPEQKYWYVAVRDADFQGEEDKMWQEYPGTPEEAFQVSIEGHYYAKQMASARKGGRILNIPVLEHPTHTFWDIGRSDSTAIWFMQHVGPEYRFTRYFEDSGQTIGFYVKYLKDTGYIFGKHYLPHDAAHKRLSDTNKSVVDMLVDAGIPESDIIVVERISDEQAGIQQTRAAFPACYFDDEGTEQGRRMLTGFKRRWNKTTGAWASEPEENECVHGADAFRQFGQAVASGQYVGVRVSKPLKRRGSAMAR